MMKHQIDLSRRAKLDIIISEKYTPCNLILRTLKKNGKILDPGIYITTFFIHRHFLFATFNTFSFINLLMLANFIK